MSELLLGRAVRGYSEVWDRGGLGRPARRAGRTPIIPLPEEAGYLHPASRGSGVLVVALAEQAGDRSNGGPEWVSVRLPLKAPRCIGYRPRDGSALQKSQAKTLVERNNDRPQFGIKHLAYGLDDFPWHRPIKRLRHTTCDAR